MPWSAVSVLADRLFFGVSSPFPTTKWTDYAFFFLLFAIIVWIVLHNHARWPGSRSIQQHHREQRSESASLFVEGLAEFKRILRRNPPLKRYDEPDSKAFLPQLEAVSDSLAWRDQAKELIRLSSTSYAFDQDTAWHDREGCWVGSNVNTDELIILFPSQESPNEKDFDEYVRRALHLVEQRKSKLGELIIAVRQDTNGAFSRPGLPIRLVNEDQLLTDLVDFKDYFADVKRRATVNKLPDSDFVLAETYVPSQFQKEASQRSELTVEQYLDEWLRDPTQRHLALLGEYGQGKSTAALMWAYHQIIRLDDSKPRRIPLVIELRGTSPRNLTPLQLLGAWAARYNLNPQALMRLLIAGRLSLVFEGFDEMALVGDATMRLNHFRTLWQFAYPKAKLIITGRPNFFLDEEEMKAALGISRPTADTPYCEAIRLYPFSPQQIYEALRPYDDEVRNQIHDLAVRNDRFRDIVARPSLLHIVAVMWKRERLFEKVEQLTSALVMELFVRQSYRRQGLKEKDSPEFMALTRAEREYFMEGIAAYMGANNLPNQVSARQLNDVIRDLLAVIPDSISTDSTAIAGETRQPLRARLENNEYGREHVMTDVRACGLLVDDPSSPGTFRFGHKSFMEYLFAVVVANSIQKISYDKTRAICKTVNAQVEDVLNLPVAVEFLCELLLSRIDQDLEPSKNNDVKVARRLLKMMLGDSASERLIRQIAFSYQIATFYLAAMVLRKRDRGFRAVHRRSTLLFPLMAAVPLVVVFAGYMMSRDFSLNGFPNFLVGTVGFMMILLVALPVFSDAIPTKKRMALWLKLCQGLNIPHQVLDRVAGTSLLAHITRRSVSEYLEGEF